MTPISNNNVVIWIIDRSIDGWPYQAQMASCLTSNEQKRWQRYHFAHDRLRFLKTRYACKRILACYLRCSMQAIDWQLGQYGKPYLTTSPFEFNLSHSGDYAVLAISRNLVLGIDVEYIDASVACRELAERFFAREEITQLQSCIQQSDQLRDSFFRIWTAKESIIKALGAGLSLSLTSFAVDITRRANLIRLDDGNAKDWQLKEIEVAADYKATLACSPWVGDIDKHYFLPDC